MGGLVQQPAAPGAHRQHPAGRSRGALLRHTGKASHGGVTQTKRPPANPGRFKSPQSSWHSPRRLLRKYNQMSSSPCITALSSDGAGGVRIEYAEPKLSLLQIGVRQGTLLFDGHWQGTALFGRARVYNLVC